MKWTSKIVDYVEWVYALYEVMNAHGEKVALKTLFEVFNQVFDIEVTNFSLYFMGIKNRKKGERTTFLERQKQLLMRKMEAADHK